MNTDTDKSDRKAQIDALLLSLAGASTRKINNLDAYFAGKPLVKLIPELQ